MRNRYPGTCYRCGGNVPAGGGEIEYVSHMGVHWPQLAGYRNVMLLQHDACAIKYKGTYTHYLYAPEDEGIVIE